MEIVIYKSASSLYLTFFNKYRPKIISVLQRTTYLVNILVLPFRSDGRLVRISVAQGYL